MPPFPPIAAYQALVKLAIEEDLSSAGDVTSTVTIGASVMGVGTLYQKSPGVVAGLPIVAEVCRQVDARLVVEGIDGQPFDALEATDHGTGLRPLGRVRGPVRALLSAERTLLNFTQRMSGIATLTAQYVSKVVGTRARIFDTRKTLPGHRALDKYAVLAGGGANHRIGLFDMILVKDNHLAHLAIAHGGVERQWEAMAALARRSKQEHPSLPIEIEVVDEAGFARVLAMGSDVDVILLDNMDRAAMARCVQARDAAGSATLLEASGGINLQTVGAIAQCGVDRISVGALTHSVTALDISFEIER